MDCWFPKVINNWLEINFKCVVQLTPTTLNEAHCFINFVNLCWNSMVSHQLICFLQLYHQMTGSLTKLC